MKKTKMIERQKEKYGWEFLFIGANIDAVENASRFGIGRDRTVSNKNKIKWESHFNKENITKAFKNYFGFKNVQQKDVMKLRWKKVLGFKVGETLIKTPERAKQLLQLKYIYKGEKKVYKTISKFYTNFSSGNYNPFTKTSSAVTEFYNDLVAVPSGGA